MGRKAIGGLALAAALVLVGCSGQDEGGVPTHSASPAVPTTPGLDHPPEPTPTTPDLDQFTPPPSGLVDEDTGETVSPEAVPEWDEESRQSAVAAGDAALRAFARPDLDYDTWWAEVEPLLTPQAAEDYAYVDPANIPVREVTGEGRIVDDVSAYVATVEIPSDQGRYHIVLTRKNADAPWLVSRLTPVDQAG